MPNIFKRPMFRRGGSVAEGTGITSGLSERKQYANGPDLNDILAGGDAFGIQGMPTPKSEAEMLTDIRPGIYDLDLYKKSQQAQTPKFDPRKDEVLQQLGVMKSIEESLSQRKPKEGIATSLTGLAAAAPETGKRQSWAEFAKKYGTTVAGLEKGREDAAQSFRTQAGLQILKNMTSEEKDQLFRYAKKYAETKGIPVEQAYQLFLDRYLKGTPSKGLTTDRLISDYQKALIASPSLGYGAGDALIVAKTQAAIFEGKAKGHEGANPSPVKIYDGQASAKDFKGVRTGDKFINPFDGAIYTFDGFDKTNTKATFTKVWPTN